MSEPQKPPEEDCDACHGTRVVLENGFVVACRACGGTGIKPS